MVAWGSCILAAWSYDGKNAQRLVARCTCPLAVSQICFPISLQANDGFRLNFLPYFNKDCS